MLGYLTIGIFNYLKNKKVLKIVNADCVVVVDKIYKFIHLIIN